MSAHVTNKQVKVTLNKALTGEMDRLCHHLGLPPSSVVKVAIRKLAQAELPQNEVYKNIAPSELEGAA
jgi:antitoxin component of RelBE/YafQ-DinJ toxin-antitoxin module